jgi:hypothetical protein
MEYIAGLIVVVGIVVILAVPKRKATLRSDDE